MLHLIKWLRDKKFYRLADYLRDKLVDVGYYWFMPEKINLGNLSGHTHKKLRFGIEKNGKISIKGYIHSEKSGKMITIQNRTFFYAPFEEEFYYSA